ncbi:hypothetical protein H4582DRAFT_1379110 [Lactarius indigo]|nr:hypothetical protein H4582DRAFT_1379110 [Lactarius indigo]
MSSPDPPQLRISLPSTAPTFKRSFDQFGFDLETPVDSSLVASSSTTDEHRPGPSNTDRNKRARSNSVTPNNSNSAEQARSIDASPSGPSHTAANHMTTTHRDAPLLPPPPPVARHLRAPNGDSNDSVFSPGISLGEEPTHTPTLSFESRSSDSSINPPTSTTWSNPPSTANPTAEHNEQFRLSMERFHAFDSQISSIRARPSPLPLRAPSNPPTLPPLTLSSTIEHPHAHLNPVVSLPSVESFNYTAPSAQAAAAPPPVAPPPIASSTTDQYRSDMSPLGFEEFGEFREIMGFFPEQNSNSRSVDRSAVRPRQSSAPLDNSARHRVDRPLRGSPTRQNAENVSRTSTLRPWPVGHRSVIFGDSDDEFGDLPVVSSLQGRRSLDLPRSRLDPSLLANRIRRTMRNQAAHEALGRMSPPRFPTPTSSQIESSQTRSVNHARIPEHERPDGYEHRSLHPPSRLYPPSRRPVLPEAVRTLAERLGRGRQRTDYTGEGGTERSRSPAAATFSSSTSAYDDWLFELPEFASSESPYALDLPTPSSWIDEDSTPSRPSIPSSRIQRDVSIPRPAPWRSPQPSNDTSEDRILTYLSLMHRIPSTVPLGEETQPDPVWRRLSSFTDYHPSHFQPTRTSSGHGDGTNNTPLTRATHSTESSSTGTSSQDGGMGWLRSLARAELNHGLVHERDTSSASITSSSFSDRPSAERSSASIRGFIDRRPHLQPPSRIPLDSSTRRPSEAYRPVQAMDVTNDMTVDTDPLRPDESSDVPFSSHAAALFASRGTSSTVEPTSLRRPDFVDIDRMTALPIYPRASRVEGDFAISASRRRANVGERRHRTSPDPERLGTIRRFTTTEPPASFTPGSRPLDIEEFQHGPFRATLERLERRELQEHQIIMERQAEIDRLRSRLDELQSLDRPSASSRTPTLPPLRFDREPLVSEAPHRIPSSTPPTNIDSSPFRADIEATHRRRSWNRGRGNRSSWLPGDEPAPWRSSSNRPTPPAPVPIPRAHSPPRPLPESLDPHPPRRRPETLELLSFGDMDEYSLDNLMVPPLAPKCRRATIAERTTW